MHTPFEAAQVRALQLGVGMIESMALSSLVLNADEYETRMREVGGGTPPLTEVVHIGLMWRSITQMTVIEA